MNGFGGESEPLVTVLDVRRNASSDELFRNRYPNDRIQAGRKPAQLFLVLASVLVAVAVLRANHQKVDASSMQQITAQLIRTNTDTTKATNPEDDNIQDVANRALQTLNESIKTVPKDECKVTVLITRHCNDYGVYAMEDADSGDKHCSFVGYERTEYFAEKFESHKAQTNEQVHRRWPLPSALYALLPEQATQIGGINYRQIEMLLPLAKRTHVSIQVVGTPEQAAESIHKKLQQDGDVCGQVMVIAWKHRFIPNVAAALGCGPDQGCYESYPDEEFDQVWQLRFIYEPPAPEDEVLRLLDEGSFLLQDDFGLLAEQKKWQEQLLDLEGNRNDRYQHPSAETGWTVYGGRTNQEFDPLQYEYHKEM